MPKIKRQLSLFQKYPELVRKLPQLELGNFPTAVHPLQRLGIENFWIKRDDQSSPDYGGNKIRKLEIILAAACQKKIRHLVTAGGIGTNHGLATAIFCDQLGIKCTLLLYYQPVTESVQQSLLLLGRYKARLIYRKTLWRTMVNYFGIYRLKCPCAYFVYPGGSSTIGNIGYVNAAFELKNQIRSRDPAGTCDNFLPLELRRHSGRFSTRSTVGRIEYSGAGCAGNAISPGSFSSLHSANGCKTDTAYLWLFKEKMSGSAGYFHPGAGDLNGLFRKRLRCAHPGRKQSLSSAAGTGRYSSGSDIYCQDICRRTGLLPQSSGGSWSGVVLAYL